MSNQRQILIVEDDIDLGNVLAEYLKIKGFDISLYRDAESALASQLTNIDLAILDVSLPGMNGFELGEALNRKNLDIPFLFLSARNQKHDKLRGLKLGADDYITKPFEVEELVLRVKIILKRTVPSSNNQVNLGSLVLDSQNLTLTNLKGNVIHLTEKEAKLMSLFITNKNQLLKREYILNELWGDDDYFNGRSMDVFITRVRKYIKEESNIELINVRGIGFKLVLN